MDIQTTRFGKIHVADNQIITMPEGIIGFEGKMRYALLDHSEDSPFKWFQSVEEPGLAFVVMDPFPFFPDYKVDIADADLKILDTKDSEDLLILIFVSIKRDRAAVSANLLGPIVINLKNLVARQLVLSDTSYSPSHKIFSSDPVGSLSQRGGERMAPPLASSPA